MLAYSRNEAIQIARDPVRLAFAFVGSALLMLVFGFGITSEIAMAKVWSCRAAPRRSRASRGGYRRSRICCRRGIS
jgi:hypothetical protein